MNLAKNPNIEKHLYKTNEIKTIFKYRLEFYLNTSKALSIIYPIYLLNLSGSFDMSITFFTSELTTFAYFKLDVAFFVQSYISYMI